MERESKLQKIGELRQTVPFVTKSALSKILDHVEKEGVPQLHSRKHMAESTAKFLSKACAYGPIFLSKKLFNSDGSTCEVKILNFWSFLDFAFQSGGSLYKLLSSVTASAGLILYTDEIVVGNPLAHKPRKLWAVYCACQPFGVHLQDDNSWITLAIVKSSVVQKLGGQLSQLMKEILLSIFFSGACEPLHFGVQLSNPAPLTGKRKMQFHLAYIIQDGGAHKYFWNIKGGGGSRYCIKCRNVFAGKDEDSVDPISAYTKVSDLSFTTKDEIFDSWDRLEKRKRECNATTFRQWEQATGFCWSEHSILGCKELRPALDPQKHYVHDWLHGLLSNGLLCLATAYVLGEAELWETFAQYIGSWHLPSQWATINLQRLFDKKAIDRHRKSEQFVSTASEMLSVCHILLHYLAKVCSSKCKDLAAVYMALVHLLEILQSTWTGIVSSTMIQSAAAQALHLWKALGWPMKPKHHWLLHFAQAYAEHGQALCCFAQERSTNCFAST